MLYPDQVVRMHQQQENLKFMSHFPHGLIIKQGRRKVRCMIDLLPYDRIYLSIYQIDITCIAIIIM